MTETWKVKLILKNAALCGFQAGVGVSSGEGRRFSPKLWHFGYTQSCHSLLEPTESQNLGWKRPLRSLRPTYFESLHCSLALNITNLVFPKFFGLMEAIPCLYKCCITKTLQTTLLLKACSLGLVEIWGKTSLTISIRIFHPANNPVYFGSSSRFTHHINVSPHREVALNNRR